MQLEMNLIDDNTKTYLNFLLSSHAFGNKITMFFEFAIFNNNSSVDHFMNNSDSPPNPQLNTSVTASQNPEP